MSAKCDRWDLGGNACKDAIIDCFLRFLHPPDERKNPDWSELIGSTEPIVLFCQIYVG